MVTTKIRYLSINSSSSSSSSSCCLELALNRNYTHTVVQQRVLAERRSRLIRKIHEETEWKGRNDSSGVQKLRNYYSSYSLTNGPIRGFQETHPLFPLLCYTPLLPLLRDCLCVLLELTCKFKMEIKEIQRDKNVMEMPLNRSMESFSFLQEVD